MGDDEDRARLEGMTELEREEILADRRDARAKIQDRKRIIQMAKEKREREAGGKKKFRPADAAAASGRKSTRVAAADDGRQKTGKSKALADIARKKASARARDDDDDDDDDSDEYDDEELEDEELDGILPTRERRPRARGRARARDGDYSEDDEDDDEGGDRVPASEAQIRKIILPRSTLERWISEPFVKALAPGCMVRIGIGQDANTGQNKYRLAEIADVLEGKHEDKNYVLREYEYGVPNSGKRTDRWLLLRFGVNERAFRITEISNSETTESEYAAWRAQMEKDERRMPRLREVTAAAENITRADNYRYTSEDVQKMLEKRAAAKSGLRHNLAGQKETLRRLIELAKAEGDADAVANLEQQLATVVEQLNARLNKGGTQAVMAAINKRNNQMNDANLSRIASEAVARAKSGKPDESANDPFSRRPTRARTYYTINSKAEDEAAAAAAAAAAEAEAKTPAAVKTAGGRGGPKTPRTPKAGSLSSYSVAAAAKLAALKRAHAVDLPGVTPSLASAPDPAAGVGLSPGLVPVLRRGLLGIGGGLLGDIVPRPPRGKTLTLEEYKVRQGIE